MNLHCSTPQKNSLSGVRVSQETRDYLVTDIGPAYGVSAETVILLLASREISYLVDHAPAQPVASIPAWLFKDGSTGSAGRYVGTKSAHNGARDVVLASSVGVLTASAVIAAGSVPPLDAVY